MARGAGAAEATSVTGRPPSPATLPGPCGVSAGAIEGTGLGGMLGLELGLLLGEPLGIKLGERLGELPGLGLGEGSEGAGDLNTGSVAMGPGGVIAGSGVGDIDGEGAVPETGSGSGRSGSGSGRSASLTGSSVPCGASAGGKEEIGTVGSGGEEAVAGTDTSAWITHCGFETTPVKPGRYL